jgi:hypothetical protein
VRRIYCVASRVHSNQMYVETIAPTFVLLRSRFFLAMGDAVDREL